uniref:MFS domain-containing protein n=1 Tax=Globodera pallida TaxID=36090 RepID=A0A183BKT9_GLOPA
MFYSYDIFKSAGLRGQWPDLATLAMGAVNVLMTFISVVLMERLGRRTLHITGLVGMLLSSAFIAISMLASQSIQWFSYFSILFVLLFVISAAIGPGAIPWFFVNEIFPLNARGNANSIAVLSNWGSNAIVGFFFPILNSIMNEYVFFVFTAILVMFVIFAAKFMPETKNKTLDDIQIEMDRRRGETSCRQATVSHFLQYADTDVTMVVLKYHFEYSSDMLNHGSLNHGLFALMLVF